MKYLLFLSFFIISCNKEIRVKVVNDDLYSYALEFVHDGEIQGRVVKVDNISLMFGYTGYAVGVCKYGNDFNTITINKDYWDKLDYWTRKQLMYHELGHCVLNKHYHNTNYLPNTYYPQSIMLPYLFDGQIFKNNYNYYIQELFRR